MSDEPEDGGITAEDLGGGDTPIDTPAEKQDDIDASVFQEFDLGEEDPDTPPAEAKEKEQDAAVDELEPNAPAIAKQLKEKYPNIFKEIPSLRKALFAGPQVLEVFPTPEEARTAYKRIEAMDYVVERATSGDVGVILDNIYDANPGSIKAFTDNFLPTLQQRSPELFKSAIGPVFATAIRAMQEQAEKAQNKALWMTAKNFSQFMFGSPDPPEVGKPQNNAPDPEKQQLSERTKQLSEVLANNFMKGVTSVTSASLEKEVSERLDPKNAIPPGLKKIFVSQAVKDIREKLSSDQQHLNRMVLLRQRAAKDNYSDNHKQALIDGYLSSARNILPGVVSELRAQIIAKQQNGKNPTPKANGNAQDKNRDTKGRFVEGSVSADRVNWSAYKNDKDFLFGEKVAVK